ncbi:uncharacterized protein [Physcomitrium patens]|uniref:Uncharacterized protein n=1 Tax=Physcomitrium patens TaxID=3218 RepID=A0A2K1JUP8_PHYPA|nr:uncharacterized protein LOC112288196 [Physcomitrium patens]PNR45253.1 hypothetical protein PHYPA_015024 [Physcomitrium patens]|eukprot:XP_024387919.1 uncharacterized protein LOC112288196 [Physcomitrella patens]
MAGSWRGSTLLLLLVCSVLQLAASAETSANYQQEVLRAFDKGLRRRGLLQAGGVPATPPVSSTVPPVSATRPPVSATLPPVSAAAPPKAAGPAPAPAPAAPPALPPRAPPTPVRTYLMWIGIGAFCLVLLSVIIFCLCRKFGDQKIRGAQRLPPLPRYH